MAATEAAQRAALEAAAEQRAAIEAAVERGKFEGTVLRTLEDIQGDIRHIRATQVSVSDRLPADFMPRKEIEIHHASFASRLATIEQTQGWFVRKLLTAALGGGGITAAGASAALYLLGLKVGK